MTANNLALIVLIHNQSQNLPRLIAAYKGLASSPALFVFVLDRCTDNSKLILESSGLNCKIVEVRLASLFRAGANRDIGLCEAERHLPGCDVVFLDGDCVPTPGLIEAHARNLSLNRNFPTTTISRRINENEIGQDLHDDTRIIHARANRRVFGNSDRLVMTKVPANSRMLTWSCNLGLNRKMIDLCRWANDQLSNEQGRVFNDAFDGRWGGEDDFVGLTASYFGGAVIAIDPKHHVRHIWHVSRQSDEYARTMRVKTGQLKDLAKQTGALGFTRIDASNAIEDVDRCAAATAVDLRDPVLQLAFDSVGASGNFEVSGLATAFSYPMWIFNQSAVEANNRDKERWIELRTKLFKLYALDLPASKLSGLTWNFKPLTRSMCCVCGSDRGIASNGRCRSCNSYPWHRLASKFVGKYSGHRAIFNPDTRAEQLVFSDWDKYSYSGMSGVKADLEQLSIPDEMYDVTYSAHTLEHVKDDRKALRELHRITKLGGLVVFSVPLSEEGRTAEDLGPLTKEERTTRFWWHDHWRLYGRDAAQRFADLGFDVELHQAAQHGHIDGVSPDETVFVLRKLGVHVKQQLTPKSLYLDVYDSCNYACKHCSIHQLRDEQQVNIDLYRAAVAEFAVLGGTDMQFGSGETLLKRQIVLDLISAGSRHGLTCNIVTNGSTITTQQQANDLKDAGLHAATISVDSHVAAEHDAVRGVPGAFDRAINAGALLRNAGVQTKASCVLNRSNMDAFPEYANTMRKLGFQSVGFTLLEPTFALSRFKRDEYYEQNRVTDHVRLRQVLLSAIHSCVYTHEDIDRVASAVERGSPANGDCDSSERNVMIGRDGQVRLCYGKAPIGTFQSAGDLRRIWQSAVALNRRYEDRRCSRPCAISDCHRRKSLNS
jgi:MoaA/NifB/PqqE/SkfB family radical SAM enzyme/SAM-dependent methyltransferase